MSGLTTGSGESPAVARRRVRLAVRRAREAVGLTQGQVAEEMEWSLSKVMRIESGDVGISGTDLRALVALYGITDKDTIAHLMEDARTSRKQQRWWVDARYRTQLTGPLLQYIQFETDATVIRQYQNVLVPGCLQTDEYAHAVLETFGEKLSAEEIEVRADVRSRRRRHILEQPAPPELLIILDESVLYREVGGRQVMGQQLLAVANAVGRQGSRARVRIVPFAAAATIALFGPFTILDLEDEEGALLYRETYLVDEAVQNPENINRHRRIFDELWELAYDDAASLRMMSNRAELMLSERMDGGPA